VKVEVYFTGSEILCVALTGKWVCNTVEHQGLRFILLRKGNRAERRDTTWSSVALTVVDPDPSQRPTLMAYNVHHLRRVIAKYAWMFVDPLSQKRGKVVKRYLHIPLRRQTCQGSRSER
jgi:hypothetical protein